MTHFKKYYPTGFVDESDLVKDRTATILSVCVEQVPIPGRGLDKQCACKSVDDNGKRIPYGKCCAMKVVMTFDGAKKKLVLNKTNAVRVSKLYGNNTKDWVGKAVTLYFDPKVMFGRDQVGGIRIRESIPAPKVAPKTAEAKKEAQ